MLADYEINLWYSSVLKSETIQKALYGHLSPDERERAARFRFDEHRNAYIVARGLLRSILSHYVGIGPEKLQFTYGSRGKPALHDAPVHFNVSHSKDITVYAIAREPRVGVDVEHLRPMPDLDTIARQFFSPAEYHNLLALNINQRCEGFFNCWTRKEAYVKAIGDGLYALLDQFQVTLGPKQAPTLVAIQGDEILASEWSMFDWKPSEQYAAAVVIYGRGWHCEEKSMALIGL
jgi:4'-phosphopantetheinyl transferase